MKKLALISSGFLRNYRFFLKDDLYLSLLNDYECDVYISTWEEDGYGGNHTMEYTSGIISEGEIRDSFGDHLKFLKRLSFSGQKNLFNYSPVRKLLGGEPHVLEKYRSKFYSLKQVEIDDLYDVYFHVRLDMQIDDEARSCLLDCLSGYEKNDKVVYTSRDLLDRPGCFGDSYQIFGHDDFKFLQGFYERLYSDEYLNLDIPHVPERILHLYYSDCQKEIKQVPHAVILNRSIFRTPA